MYINNNKKHLYQWDLNQEVIVEDELVKYVHFSSVATGNALVVEVVNKKATIPNIMLQEAWDIKAYGFCGECVREDLIISIVARAKPDDYMYSETECKTWDEFEQRITVLEEDIDETIINTINQYFIDNPVQPGATEAEAAQIAQNTEDIQVIKKDYAKKTDIPDVSDYATEAFVNEAIGSIEIPEQPDLSEYAKKSDIPDMSKYALKTEIPDVSNFALKSDIPDVSSFMDADEVAAAINQALGVLENGTY